MSNVKPPGEVGDPTSKYFGNAAGNAKDKDGERKKEPPSELAIRYQLIDALKGEQQLPVRVEDKETGKNGQFVMETTDGYCDVEWSDGKTTTIHPETLKRLLDTIL